MPSFAFKYLYEYWLVLSITGVSIACLGMVLTHTTFMIRTKLTKLHLTPISLHSASSVRIPTSFNNFRDMLPTIRLPPLGSPIFRKYTKPFNAFKRRGMYPNVCRCNAKRCVSCTHLCTKTTITSSVNGMQFSIINNNDMDWTSSDLIYVITWTEINCGMQYVGQTGRSLKIWDTFNTLAMSSCFMPAFLMAILHILSSFFFVESSNIHVLRLLHDSTAKEIHSCISTWAVMKLNELSQSW